MYRYKRNWREYSLERRGGGEGGRKKRRKRGVRRRIPRYNRKRKRKKRKRTRTRAEEGVTELLMSNQ